MSEEIEETRQELKIQESFVHQLAETNKELESENATQVAIAADAKDRGRAPLRDDTVRISKRHNSKTRKSDTTNGPQQQGQVMLYQATMAASSSSVQAPNVPTPIGYSLGPGSVLFPAYQDPMIQAHIDQLPGSRTCSCPSRNRRAKST